MLAAVDEGIRSIEEEGGTPAEEVRKLIPKWNYKVINSPNAISDLAEIVRFVAQDDPQAALRLGKQLADDADSLARLPYRFPNFRRRANVRKLVTGQYLILYRIVQTAKVVEILRFWHGARETPRL
jgi:toxin ParE1/3/4